MNVDVIKTSNSNRSFVSKFFAFPFLPRWLRYLIYVACSSFLVIYVTLFCQVSSRANTLIHQTIPKKSDAALILGYRAYTNGAPNICLTGRVDTGVSLAKEGVVSILVMTGGRDHKRNVIEADVMAAYAKRKGFGGPILLERASTSTKENLRFSAPILKAAHIKRLIIVSEPYHLWRTEKLVEAGNLGHQFNVSYVAAPSRCWVDWGMLSIGALREPLAIMNNFAKGYF